MRTVYGSHSAIRAVWLSLVFSIFLATTPVHACDSDASVIAASTFEEQVGNSPVMDIAWQMPSRNLADMAHVNQLNPAAYYQDEDAVAVAAAPDEITIEENPAGKKRRWTDHVSGAQSGYSSFSSKVKVAGTETLLLFGFFTAINGTKLFHETESFHFHDEGWFGKNTENLGIDKLAHAHNTYLIAEFLHDRIHRKTGGAQGDALTAAALASSLVIYSEFYDAIETTSGFSWQDVTFNTAGAAFSIARNTVPGLREKLDFRLMLIPNSDIYTRVGKRHYAQQRYLLALKFSGFESLRESPLRFMELHAGYYASDFTHAAVREGKTAKRHLFFGLGVNVAELLFGKSESRVARTSSTVLNYLQIPYTAVHVDAHGRISP